MADVQPKSTQPLGPQHCGATRRDGQPCRALKRGDSGRCRVHGGAEGSGAPRGNTNAVKHGFYRNYLSDEEKPMYDEALAQGSGASTLEHELAMMRVKLTRLLKAARDAGNEDISDRVERHVDIIMKAGIGINGNELGTYDKKELKSTLPHLGSLIDQCVNSIRRLCLSIAQLKVTEKELAQDEQDHSDLAVVFTRLSREDRQIDTES